MPQHDPNLPDTPLPQSGSSEDLPQEPRVVPSASEEMSDSADAEHFVQEDIAEPLEATIADEETPEKPSHATSRISMELFQQADIAEPFEAAIPQTVLEGSDTTPVPSLAQVAHTPEAAPEHDSPVSISEAGAEQPLLFDDDYSPRPVLTQDVQNTDRPAEREISFQSEEFGTATPLTSSPAAPEPVRSFDDLTLSEVLGLFVRRPSATFNALIEVLTDSTDARKKKAAETLALETGSTAAPEQKRSVWSFIQANVDTLDLVTLTFQFLAYLMALWGCLRFVGEAFNRRQESVQLVGGFPSLVIAAISWLIAELIQHRQGIRAWVRSRTAANWVLMALRLIPIGLFLWVLLRWMDASDEPYDQLQTVLDMIRPTFPVLALGIVAWLGIDGLHWILGKISSRPSPLYPRDFTDLSSDTVPESTADAASAAAPFNISGSSYGLFPAIDFEGQDVFRIISAICSTILAVVTYLGTSGNRMGDPIFYTWIASAVLWAIALSPKSWQPLEWSQRWRRHIRAAFQIRPSLWAVAAVIGIAALAFVMRTDRLYGDPAQGTRIPPEMTSDHVEKILDAQRVLEGPRSPECDGRPACNRDIFFANNGGREPFQMYALAFIANATGRDVDYNLLKTLAAAESLLTLPIIAWLAWEILASEKRSLRVLFAFIAVGLVAVSYWHLNITRLSLRIVLTPAITALLMIYLTRAMRRNHRADFIKAGICLGAGLYMYQAVRMLPLVVVAGIAIAVYFGTIHWRARGRYILNLAALVLMSFVIFVPMFHYSVENPDMFLRRTAGRLFGDDVITTTLEDGTVIERKPTLSDQLEAFQKNIPVLLSNIRNALLMFNWKGDVAWINNAPNWPALDPFVGALMVVGVVAWFSLAIRRGDTVYAFVPIIILIMLLPSALSIAYPIENPSFTRTSGALPAVFLLAAYPLALGIEQISVVFAGRSVGRAFRGIIAIIILASYSYSMSLYTTDFVDAYKSASLPYSQAGQVLRGFAESDGSFGNAFMVAYTYWWDHRAVGLEAGLTDWPNGIITRDDIPRFLRDAAQRTDLKYRLDPLKDLLFFYSELDVDTSAYLKQLFPEGRETRMTTYQSGDNYMLYRVPALGNDGFLTFIAQYITQ